MKGRRPGGTPEHAAPTVGREERNRQRRLDGDGGLRANPPQQLEHFTIAAKEHVLPVVDELPLRAIDERGGAPAKLAPRLEDDDPPAAPGKRRRRRDPPDA